VSAPAKRSSSTPAKRARYGITRRQRERFLEELRRGSTITGAAAAAGKSRRAFRHLVDGDEDFAEAYRLALEEGVDAIEDELRAAATEGWEETEETLDGDGNVMRRTTRQRRDPRLLARIREWRRPPVTAQVTTSFQYEPPEGFVAPTLADVAALARKLGARPDQWVLGEIAEVIEAQAVEVRELEPGDES
jgi:hypothetical protein